MDAYHQYAIDTTDGENTDFWQSQLNFNHDDLKYKLLFHGSYGQNYFLIKMLQFLLQDIILTDIFVMGKIIRMLSV